LSQNASPGKVAAPHTGQDVEPMPFALPMCELTVSPGTALGEEAGAFAFFPRTGVPHTSQNDTPSGSSVPQFEQ
jgi:hypothetical protein